MKKISDLFSDEEKKQLSYLGSMLHQEPTEEEAEQQKILDRFVGHCERQGREAGGSREGDRSRRGRGLAGDGDILGGERQRDRAGCDQWDYTPKGITEIFKGRKNPTGEQVLVMLELMKARR